MIKKLLLAALILGVGGAAVYFFYVKKPRVTTDAKKTEITTTAAELADKYDDAKYLGKIIEVSGKVASVEKTNDATLVVLETGAASAVACSFSQNTPPPSVSAGQEVVLKCQCNGKSTGDFPDVNLSSCMFIK